jgi:hypothetical protein
VVATIWASTRISVPASSIAATTSPRTPRRIS